MQNGFFKVTRSRDKKSLPKDFAYIIEELLLNKMEK
jgi:fructose-1,6-bisphosphatase